MNFEAIQKALELGLPTGLIVVGVAFAILKLWPWWEKVNALERDRHHELELRTIETSGLMAGALSLIAEQQRKQQETDDNLARAITALGDHLQQPIKVQVSKDP